MRHSEHEPRLRVFDHYGVGLYESGEHAGVWWQFGVLCECRSVGDGAGDRVDRRGGAGVDYYLEGFVERLDVWRIEFWI